MKVIFLDIDGVLNSHNISEAVYAKTGKNGYGGFFKEEDVATKDNIIWGEDLVKNLKTIVDRTGAVIVISSTWRKSFSVDKFKEMFAVYGWNDAPVIDKTPMKMSMRNRGVEIKEWLRSNEGVTHYVILDDDDDFFTEQQPFCVYTWFELGLVKSDVERAIEILNKC